MPTILDAYCGAGGATRGYQLAGFDVTGVDIEFQPDYCGDFIQGDAVQFIKNNGYEFDFIHASPPCQTHSALTKGNRGRGWTDSHTDLIVATRAALESTGRPYVIENVQGSTVRRDATLCGLMFDLKVFRHRYFEAQGFTLDAPDHPSHKGHRVAGWRHGVKYAGDMVAVYGDGGGKGSVEDWQNAMGIHWTDDKISIAEAIPPAYALYVGMMMLRGR